MNSKEIIKKASKLEKTSRIPVTLLSGGAWTFNRRGLSLKDAVELAPEAAAQIIMETNEEVRSDIIWTAAGCNNLGVRAIGGKVNFRKRGAPDIQEAVIQTPDGVDELDLNKLTQDAGIVNLLETTKILAKNVGDRTMIGISQWGPLTLAGHIYGIEKIMRGMIKDKPAVHTVLEFTSELCYRYLELFIDAGAEMISMADPSASGDMVSKGQFMEFGIPYLNKVAAKVREKGIVSMIHICGDITKFLDVIPQTGVDVISLDYKVALDKAREMLDGKMAFTGNMNPVSIMQDSSPQTVAEKCLECITQAGGSKNGYIMMPGCDIPPDVPLENLRAMVDTAHNYLIN